MASGLPGQKEATRLGRWFNVGKTQVILSWTQASFGLSWLVLQPDHRYVYRTSSSMPQGLSPVLLVSRGGSNVMHAELQLDHRYLYRTSSSMP